MTDPPAASATSSDSDLITAVRDGDADAYGFLYERHSARALRLARQIVPEQADADDVVSETFTKVLAAIRSGAGPTEAFLPYLLTAVRRVAFDQVKARRAQVPTDDADLDDQGEPFADPAEARLERTLIARAFAALPERWSAVLWLTEVEQARPADVALQLGISPNSVAALRYRAREGLRQSYLQMHVSRARSECQPVAGLLGGYVRGALSRRDAKRVDEHLATCAACQAARAELDAINGTMRGVLAPVLLGGAATGYLAHGGHAATAGWIQAASRTFQRIPWHRAGAQAAAAVAVAGIAVTVTLTNPRHASPSTAGPLGLAPPAGSASRSGGAQGPSGPGGHAGPGGPGPGRRASPTPAPTGRGSRSPRPSPSGPVSGTPTPAPSSPRPGPTGPSAAAELSVGVTVNGLLNLGVIDVVSVNVSDPGTAATEGLTVNLGLPAGITLLGLGSGSASWTCSGTSCTHAAIGAGAAATVSFRVLVASLTGCGNPVTATAVSGALTATGQSAKQVQCG